MHNLLSQCFRTSTTQLPPRAHSAARYSAPNTKCSGTNIGHVPTAHATSSDTSKTWTGVEARAGEEVALQLLQPDLQRQEQPAVKLSASSSNSSKVEQAPFNTSSSPFEVK